MHQSFEENRLDVEELPDLDTMVAVSDSPKQQEVGGIICTGIAIGIAVVAIL